MKVALTPNRKSLFALSSALLAALIFQTAFQWRQTHYIWVEVPRMRIVVNSLPGIELKEVSDIGGLDGLEMWVTLQVKDKGQVVLFNPTYETFAKSNVPVSILGIGDCLLVGGSLAKLPFQQIVDEYEVLYETAQIQLNSC